MAKARARTRYAPHAPHTPHAYTNFTHTLTHRTLLPPQGHALLIPKAEGYATIYDMPPDVAGAVLRELPRLAKAVQAATGCDGVNIVQNNGGAAGQVVFHAHFHVIPRTEGDGLVKLGAHGGAAKMIAPEDGKAISDAIKAAL
jgi:diadenosine tetraphosphate (Ap4A) HIT family hydrolase